MQNSNFTPPRVDYLQSMYVHHPPKNNRTWGRYILELYSNRCILTGKHADEILVEKHHLYPKKDFPNLDLSLYNGIPLCKELHRDFHNRYRTSFTGFEFIDYIEGLERGSLSHLQPRLAGVKTWLIFLNEECLRELHLLHLNQGVIHK